MTDKVKETANKPDNGNMAIIDKNIKEELLSRYPDTRSATIPLLWQVQNKIGWISPEGVEEVAAAAKTSPAEVWEVVTFYTMFRRQPVGKYVISLCSGLSCSLNNADSLLGYIEKKLGIKNGETTKDKIFTIETVECIGACTEAPAMLLNEDLYINLTPEKVDKIIENCRKS